MSEKPSQPKTATRQGYGTAEGQEVQVIQDGSSFTARLVALVDQYESELVRPALRKWQVEQKWHKLADVLNRYCFIVFSAFFVVCTMTLLVPM